MATYFGMGDAYTAYVDMTLTRSKVKVTGLLNFRQLVKPCMLVAMTAAPLRGFLVSVTYFIQLSYFYFELFMKLYRTRMWANAPCDGRPAEYRWRPLFNATKFG